MMQWMDRFEFNESHAQRINPDEAREVVERWMSRQQEQERIQDWPSVQDLAEALRTSPAEVQRMLVEVRSTPRIVPVPVVARPGIPARFWHIGLAMAGACCIAAF